ncbi:MAG: fibronectin type III domain-containing protein [Lachnospiraceae bacterium]|nr:fibronectin type III domain-containing protein [Lachnospiraceae bacterium]
MENWKKASNVTGYTIRYSTVKSMKGAKTITIKKASATKQVIKKLSSKKKYYFQIQTYKTLNKKTYRSGWSKAGSFIIR